MPVSSWSPTAASNTGILTGIVLDGSSMNVPLTDDAFREMAAQIAAQLGKVNFKGADIASAATTNLSTATGWYVDVTGTTTITSLGTVAAGQVFILRFASSLQITHHATNLILPNGNIYTTGGDVGIFVSLGAGAWRLLNYIGAGGSSVPAGSIIDFAGTTAPAGWLMCYGQSVSRATYAALFAAIGTTYGSADGSSFKLPDLRGVVVAGKDNMGGTATGWLTNRPGGIDGNTLGALGGWETHILTTAQLSSHTHTQQGTFASGGHSVDHSHFFSGQTNTDGAHAHNLAGGWVGAKNNSGGSAGTTDIGSAVNSITSTDGVHAHLFSGNTGGVSANHSHNTTIYGETAAAGSGSAHNNVQPTIILNKIIKI